MGGGYRVLSAQNRGRRPMKADTSLPSDAFQALPISDHAALRAALDAAHLPTLLMVLVHLTGERYLLTKFAPHIRPLFSGGIQIPEEMAQDLRRRLFAVLTAPAPPLSLAEPSGAAALQMMSTCVGEPVDPEFLPMLVEQMGFRPVSWRARDIPDGFRILVIGSGMAGLCNAIMLERAGYDYAIFEKNSEVGGTWWVNRYPGVGVDTPSHFYSLSFAQNPDWRHFYPKGGDMRAYFCQVADQHRLRDRISFGTEVLACIWNDAEGIWDVETRTADGGSQRHKFNVVVSANGLVDRPSIPKIKGLEKFRGVVCHTARWDEAIDLTGKRVAVVGTGASSAQFAPAIAPQVAHLTVFQRSKHWIIPNPDYFKQVSEGEKWAMRHIPYYAQWYRFTAFWWASDGLYPNVRRDPDWQSDTSVSALNEGIRQFALSYLKDKLADRPDLWDKVTPDFPIFSKRIVLDPGWFDMLKRSNVSLEVSGIQEVTEEGIVGRDGTLHPVDVIALATGFEIQRMLAPMHIVGRHGRSVRDLWGDDEAEAYMGIALPGFPNFFVTPGPNSAPNHAGGQNIVAEIHAKYLVDALNMALDRQASVLEVTEDANQAWNEALQAEMQHMIWSHPRAHSYYRNARGRVTVSSPYRLVDYWTMMSQPRPADFRFARASRA